MRTLDALNASSVDLLFIAGCKEEDIATVKRALNREILLAFYRNDIEVPFTTFTVHNE